MRECEKTEQMRGKLERRESYSERTKALNPFEMFLRALSTKRSLLRNVLVVPGMKKRTTVQKFGTQMRPE